MGNASKSDALDFIGFLISRLYHAPPIVIGKNPTDPQTTLGGARLPPTQKYLALVARLYELNLVHNGVN